MAARSLYRPLGGIELPKLAVSSSLVFLGGLGIDRLVFRELSPNGRVISLRHRYIVSSIRTAFDYRFNRVPAIFALRRRLLAYGGVNLCILIRLATEAASNAWHWFRRKKSERSIGLEGPYSAIDVAICVHQLVFWYFVPHADVVWHLVMKLLGSRRRRWLWLPGAVLGVWSFSGLLIPSAKVLYPGIHTFLAYCLYERPLHAATQIKRMIRKRFHRAIFSAFLGEPLVHEYHEINEADSEIRMLRLNAAKPWGIVRASLILVPISHAPPLKLYPTNGHRVIKSPSC
jgi:hypothetical protein